MCSVCGEHLSLISFRWDNETNVMTYVYRCEVCGELQELAYDKDDEKIQEILGNHSDIYNKYNL